MSQMYVCNTFKIHMKVIRKPQQTDLLTVEQHACTS